MQTKEKIPILAVVGPTASGKTALGVELAKAYNGEVVSADSMQIYKGMDIATAKPTPEEMQGIPHHLIDILPRDTIFNVADYVKLAEQAIADRKSQGVESCRFWSVEQGCILHHCWTMCSLQKPNRMLPCGKS